MALMVTTIALLMSSCGSKAFFDQSLAVDQQGWSSRKMAHFEVPITDTLSTYAFFLQLRHLEDYRYSNLYIFCTPVFPMAQPRTTPSNACWQNPMANGWAKHRVRCAKTESCSTAPCGFRWQAPTVSILSRQCVSNNLKASTILVSGSSKTPTTELDILKIRQKIEQYRNNTSRYRY